jgi:hypothetical protein
MAQHQGHGWQKVKKYTFMFTAEGDLAVLQTAFFQFDNIGSYKLIETLWNLLNVMFLSQGNKSLPQTRLNPHGQQSIDY